MNIFTNQNVVYQRDIFISGKRILQAFTFAKLDCNDSMFSKAIRDDLEKEQIELCRLDIFDGVEILQL